MYEIIEKNQYGLLVKNTTGTGACIHCKYERGKCGEAHNYCKLNPLYYFLPDSEAERLESENPLMNTTIDDLYIESKCYFEVKKKLDDTQKELIDLRVELRVEKEKSKALEEYLRGLELKVKELEGTIENNVTEVSKFFHDGVEIFECNSCRMLMEENEPYDNFCPNCGRKIKK